jgi:hypothetical protein
MPLVDRIVSVAVLGVLAGTLVIRAVRAWSDYHRQRRALDLLVRSVTEIEEQPSREPRL